LRRILRRAVRYGRALGFREPFFYKLVSILAETMGHVFPEIRAQQEQVEQIIQREEESFNRTLDRGLTLFEDELAAVKQLVASKGDGERVQSPLEAAIVLKSEAGLSEAERRKQRLRRRKELGHGIVSRVKQHLLLADTYGFPFDLTALIARERGFAVDEAEFKAYSERQKEIAREDHEGRVQVIELSQVKTTVPTQFVGYETLESAGKVLEVAEIKGGTAVIVDSSPFYAEMGGQVGDSGELSANGQLWRVANTQKLGNAYAHLLAEESSGAKATVLPSVGSAVTLRVDRPRRAAIQRHHTVTHLLHWALHEVVSKDASQKGSYVGAEKLTFDFTAAALTPQQLTDVEKLVNERILENGQVAWVEVKYNHVKDRKDIMQFLVKSTVIGFGCANRR
jgi:alanyl-tRNA synthetase